MQAYDIFISAVSRAFIAFKQMVGWFNQTITFVEISGETYEVSLFGLMSAGLILILIVAGILKWVLS